MRRHKELLIVKVRSHDLRRADQFYVLDFPEGAASVLVFVLLLIYKWAAEAESQVALLIVLIKHGMYFTNVTAIDVDNMKLFGLQILNDDFRSIILPDVYGDEFFKAVKFGYDQGLV